MPKRPTSSHGDNPDEVFDLIDLSDHVIGNVRRGDAHRNPSLLHRSVQVLVFDRHERLLLQRRSQWKDLFPHYYCASASGHVATGEEYAATASREVEEELGIILPLTYLDKVLVQSETETEMTAIFVACSDGPFQFHPTETEGGAFFTLAELHKARAEAALPMTPALLAALDLLDTYERAGKISKILAGL